MLWASDYNNGRVVEINPNNLSDYTVFKPTGEPLRMADRTASFRTARATSSLPAERITRSSSTTSRPTRPPPWVPSPAWTTWLRHRGLAPSFPSRPRSCCSASADSACWPLVCAAGWEGGKGSARRTAVRAEWRPAKAELEAGRHNVLDTAGSAGPVLEGYRQVDRQEPSADLLRQTGWSRCRRQPGPPSRGSSSPNNAPTSAPYEVRAADRDRERSSPALNA